MPITFEPGTEVPADGEYEAVDDAQNELGRIIGARQGQTFPPCLPHEAGYILIKTFNGPRRD
jgi:hypothetical protein